MEEELFLASIKYKLNFAISTKTGKVDNALDFRIMNIFVLFIV